MTRKILPIQSLASTAVLTIPQGSRLESVNGECSTKPTYDFTVLYESYGAVGGTIDSYSVKYCGTPNGRKVNLWKDFPQQANSSVAPATPGEVRVRVTPGTDVVLQVYYVLGQVAVA